VKTPRADIVGVQSDTQQIRGNEAELRGAHGDDANDNAVHAGDQPAVPDAASDQDGREDREHAGKIVKAHSRQQTAPRQAMHLEDQFCADWGRQPPRNQRRGKAGRATCAGQCTGREQCTRQAHELRHATALGAFEEFVELEEFAAEGVAVGGPQRIAGFGG
jgi:hypothetical protein